uniref:Putative lipocalin-2 1 n=1 Tax=Ixodes ricinus TaxID=34613 RepID=V5H093_IXORI
MKLLPFFFSLYFLAMLADAKPGEIRIDEEKKYEEYQDIKKALDNTDRRSWMYYRTYSRQTNGAQHMCVYARVGEKNEEGNTYNFEQGYTILNEGEKKEVKLALLATTYKTENRPDRKKHNAMKVTKKSGGSNGKGYQLIYSDYGCCDVLRVLEEERGAACELYLHDNCVDQPVPKTCAHLYGNACGTDDSFKKQVYNKNCKNTTEEETSKEPPPEAPESPKETTTTSTLPPGC